MPVERGRLRPSTDAPAVGERFDALIERPGIRIEQILSGAEIEPVDYVQEQDEWVVVLSGSATLDVEGELVELTAQDWVFLPAGTPHRVTTVAPGTNWLAVHHWPAPG